MDTCAWDDEIRSTDRRHLSSMENRRAKNWYETDPCFGLTLITSMFFLVVTAVGRFNLLLVRGWTDVRDLVVIIVDAASTVPTVETVALGAGKIIVPVPCGLLTFFIRIGIRSRMTCSIVKAKESADL